MGIVVAIGRLKKIGRLKQIVMIFANHGFGAVIDQLHIPQYFKLGKQSNNRPSGTEDAKLSVGERLRLSLEELGPTFVKLGQIMSTRPDLLPTQIIRELEKLQDSVPPFSIDEVRMIIEAELGDRMENLYSVFEEQPMAAASIGQVHRARLLSGKNVVVKVQRPGIQQDIELDLGILRDVAYFVDTRTRLGKLYSFSKMADEFETTLQNEMNFLVEGENAEAFRLNFLHDPATHVPEISWIHTSMRVLTMGEIRGIPLKNLEALDEAGLDKSRIARNLASSLLHQILRDGFFHGDPHPGNIMILQDNAVVFLDLGMVGKLSPQRKNQFLKMLMGITLKDSKLIVQAIIDLDAMADRINLKCLEKDIDRLRDEVLSVPLSQIKIGEVFNDVFHLAFTYNITIPSEFTMLAKSLVTLEGLVGQLDPDLNVLEIAEPIAGKLVFTLFSPEKIGKGILAGAMDYGNLIRNFPSAIVNFLAKLEHDDFTMHLALKEDDRHASRMDDWNIRLVFSVVILSISMLMSALIIGLGLSGVLGSDILAHWGFLLKAGSITVVIGLVGLIISVFLSRRRKH
jgi:ubiquinone biosynthesis protein